MSELILRGTPRSVMLGTDDDSTKQQPIVAQARPQFVPFFFLFGQQGPLEPTYVTGSEAAALYGADTFDPRKKYATHATQFMNRHLAKGGAMIAQRLQTPDVASTASWRLWADVLVTKIQDYQRNSDGSIQLDGSGNPIAKGAPVTGNKVKFLVTAAVDALGADNFGKAAQLAGDQVDSSTQTQSVRIPLLDFVAPSFGEYGNLNGIRLWAPTTGGRRPVDQNILSKESFYPFRLALVRRPDAMSSPAVVSTLAGEQYIDFSVKPGAFYHDMDKEMYLGNIFLEQYQNVSSATSSKQYSPFSHAFLYDAQISALLTQLYNAEKPLIDSFSDFDGTTANDKFRFNLFGGTTATGVPYHTYQIVTGTGGAVRLTETSNLMASGGTEGAMGNAVYGALVKAGCAQFADPSSPLKNMAKYPYSSIIDTGHPLDTKKALTQILAQRKNTWVALATHVVGQRPLTASEETSVANVLLAAVQLYPDSDYFGTNTFRGVIMGGSGRYIGGQVKEELPMTMELLDKVSDYTGGGDGKWDSASRFDVDEGRNVKLFTNLNVVSRSDDTNDQNWIVGLVTPESFDREQYYFPAFQTVYDRDDSVLNSVITMLAIADLQVIGEETRRKFSGRSDLSNLEFVTEVNKYMTAAIAGRYDNRFNIQAQAYITAFDEARGYSWTTTITIGAAGQKTVQTFQIVAKRIEDMTSSS